jgi:hypothetical protein
MIHSAANACASPPTSAKDARTCRPRLIRFYGTVLFRQNGGAHAVFDAGVVAPAIEITVCMHACILSRTESNYKIPIRAPCSYLCTVSTSQAAHHCGASPQYEICLAAGCVRMWAVERGDGRIMHVQSIGGTGRQRWGATETSKATGHTHRGILSHHPRTNLLAVCSLHQFVAHNKGF